MNVPNGNQIHARVAITDRYFSTNFKRKPNNKKNGKIDRTNHVLSFYDFSTHSAIVSNFHRHHHHRFGLYFRKHFNYNEKYCVLRMFYYYTYIDEQKEKKSFITFTSNSYLLLEKFI